MQKKEKRENMAHEKTMMRILLSSPSDTAKERAIITKIIEEINSANKETPFGIELYKWETDTAPSITLEDGQKSIDELFDYCHADMLIGIFFKRAGLGTMHEIDEAIKVKSLYGFPEIKLYFKKNDAIFSELTEKEKTHLKRIQEIKNAFLNQGVCGELYCGNDDSKNAEILRKHIQVAFDKFKNTYAKFNTYVPDINNTRINSYKLFYYRTKIKKMSIKELSKQSSISSAKLRKYEKILYSQNNIKSYPQCEYTDQRKLEKILGIELGGLSIKKENSDFELHYEYYKQNKGLQTEQKRNAPQKYKVAIFDFDGTLVAPNSSRTTWQRLWIKAGYNLDICDELHSKFDNKKISHQEWCDLTAKYFIEKEMDLQSLESVADEIVVVDGLHETLETLYNSGILLYIVSGSIKQIIYKALANDLSLFSDIQANNFIFDSNNHLIRIDGTDYDFEGKAEYVKQLSDRLSIPPKEILFIGNSFNDAHVYKSGARTLCVNPTKTNSHNKKYWHDSIDDMKNLSEIIKYFKL